MTTDLVREEDLAGYWKGRTPFPEVLAVAERLRLLRFSTRRLDDGREERSVSLGHDAMAKVAADWGNDLRRRGRRRRTLAAVAGSLALAGIMLVLALAAWRNAVVAEDRRRDAQLTSANIALNRGLSLCDERKIGQGLTWMARALELAPEDDHGLKQVIRRNVAGWTLHLSPVSLMFETGYAQKLRLHPDGRSFLVCGNAGGVMLWDISSGRPVGPKRFDEGVVLSVAISPDGRTIATGREDNVALLWDSETLKPLRVTPLNHDQRVNSVAFSPDSHCLLTGSNDRSVRLWDVKSGNCLQSIPHPGEVVSVEFSPKDERIVTTCEVNAIVWDDLKTRPRRVFTLKHGGPLSRATFSHDGSMIATASNEGSAYLWDARTGRRVGSPMRHSGRVWAVEFSPDDLTIATGGQDGTTQLWDASTGKHLRVISRMDAALTGIAFTPDGKSILALYMERIFVFRNDSDLELELTLSQGRHVQEVAFTPDGKTLLTANYDDREAQLWDRATGKPIGEPMRHDQGVQTAAFSSDGRLILTGGWDKTARLWDARTGRPAGPTSPVLDGTVYSVAFQRDGTRFVTGTFHGTARVWDTATMEPVGKEMVHNGLLTAVAFSPDGRTLLTGGSDGIVKAWDPVSNEGTGEFIGHKGLIKDIKYTSSGNTVMTASFDGTALMWDAATRRPKFGPFRHHGAVYSVELSPDGLTVATGGSDKAVRFWDVATARRSRRRSDMTMRLQTLPSARMVAAYSREDGTVKSSSGICPNTT